MAELKTYRRPMAGWWRRNPYYVRYIGRELTSVFVTAYALVLLVGLVRLSQGKAAYEAWFAALQSPLALAFHALTLLAFIWHTWTWFQVMPRTMAAPRIGGEPLSDGAITGAGVAAAVVATVFTLFVVRAI